VRGSKRAVINPRASFSGVVHGNMPVYAQEIKKRTSPEGYVLGKNILRHSLSAKEDRKKWLESK